MPEWTLMHGDCLATLREMPDDYADALVTDPPFTAAGGSTNGRSGGRQADAQFFRHWLTDALSECWRVVKPSGSAIICCDWRTLPEVEACVRTPGVRQTAKGWEVTQALVWDRGSIGLGSPFRNQFEMLAFARGPQWDRGERRRDFANVMRVRWPYGPHPNHPAEKPVDLFVPLLQFLLPPGGRVLDPFAGSATVGVAAAQAGLDYCGIEVDEDAYSVARKRLGIAYARPESSAPCKPQMGLFG